MRGSRGSRRGAGNNVDTNLLLQSEPMLTDRFIHLGKKFSTSVTVIALLSTNVGFNLPIVSAEEPNKDDLLQFTSQDHIVGFRSDGVYVASARHALTTKFLNANTVTPISDSNSEVDAAGKVPALSKVTYKNIWNGIDAVYEGGKEEIMKSTYFVDITKKGVSAKSILLRYNRPLKIDTNGNLQISFDNGIMTEKAPIAWQETPTGRHPVPVSFKLYRKNVVGFRLGDYLPNIPIVIDPSLTWNTFLGGSGSEDVIQGITVDTSGNVYIGGYTNATWGSPVRAYSSSYDGFAAKLDSSGTLTWNTFLGGNGTDYIYGIAVDTSGNVYLVGRSSATWGSPVRAYTSGTDGFAAKLDTDGTLAWNTFLGGSGSDLMYGIAVDSSGNVYVGGYSDATWGSPVRAYTLGNDGFAAKLDTNGTLTWNTFLGGSGSDTIRAFTIDNNGNVYVGGDSSATWGSPVRAYTSSTDGFVAKLDNNGTLTWNTFLGGSSDDVIRGIAVDTSGNVYVGGYSYATWGFPVRAFSAIYDGFAAKLNSSGTLTWNTFLGSNNEDVIRGIAVDTSGNVYVGGSSNATWGSPVRAYTSGFDGFAAKLDSSGTLTWNTFLGGSGSDYVYGITVDTSGSVYVGAYTNATWGSPVRAYTSGNDGFVAKINDDTTAPTVSTLSPTDNATGVSRTANLVITFSEAIGKTGTGMVTIKKTSDNATVETIAVTGSLVTGSGTTTMTINPSVTLDYSTEYYVQINAMAFPDASGNFYAGISNTTSWSFTTEAAPIVASETSASTPVVIPHGGGRGLKSPGRGGTAPLIDFKTMQVISHVTNVPTPTVTQPSSPAILLLEKKRSELTQSFEKQLEAATSLSARKRVEQKQARQLKSIDARMKRLSKRGR